MGFNVSRPRRCDECNNFTLTESEEKLTLTESGINEWLNGVQSAILGRVATTSPENVKLEIISLFGMLRESCQEELKKYEGHIQKMEKFRKGMDKDGEYRVPEMEKIWIQDKTDKLTIAIRDMTNQTMREITEELSIDA